jgi:2-haloacid dehalogenase
MEAPRAVLFDAYGTLFDVYSVSALAEELFPGHGPAISQAWRDKQIEYSRLVTTCDHGVHYQPFWELTRAALRYAIKKVAGYADSAGAGAVFDAKIERLMEQYRHLTAFPENHEVLHALKARGVITGVLSNGDPGMLGAAVASAGLGPYLDHVISVDDIRKYKTHPDAYALGPQATGVPKADTLFVSSNGWDALAATWYGFRTLWVNRQGLPFEELGTQPSRAGASLRDVLSFF